MPVRQPREMLSSHVVAAEWHPTLNGDLTPADVSVGSSRRVWWKCSECGREWQAQVVSRTRGPSSLGCLTCTRRRLGAVRSSAAAAHNPLQPHPIAAEWHPTLNGDLTPADVSVGSSRKVWWKCSECGREWQMRVAQRNPDTLGCSACVRRRLNNEGNTLEGRPVAAEWHPTLNGDLTPADVSAGSGYRAWWKCSECGREWQAQVMNRMRASGGCPSCSSERTAQAVLDAAAAYNPLSAHLIATEWHPTLNGDLTPADVSLSSNLRVWWKCSGCGHEWQARVMNRARQRTGCRACKAAEARALAVARNPLSAHPSAAQWHPARNRDVTLEEVSAGSGRRVWWQCSECGHEWQQTPNARTAPGKESGCPRCGRASACTGVQRTGVVLADHPLFAEFHPTLNSTSFDPMKRSATTSIKVWWLCPKCDGAYQAAPRKRVVDGRGCPTCDDGRRTRWMKEQ